jgi:hypothetical protein
VTAREEIEVIRSAIAVLEVTASIVPPGPWCWKDVVGRVAVLDMAGRVIAWVPSAAGADAARYITARDPRGARLEALLLRAVADGADHFLKLVSYAKPGDLAGNVCGYAEALVLARHILEAAT